MIRDSSEIPLLSLVTGQRPFLPNMAPGQWIHHVETKDYEAISVVQDVEGEVRQLRRLSETTRVSPPLCRALEPWLRSLLDWRPASRGRHPTTDTVLVFTQVINVSWSFKAPSGAQGVTICVCL